MVDRSHVFTSESVSEGHPDKIADQISDTILDEILAQDPQCRVACETLVKTGLVMIAGEITTSAWVDLEKIVRETVLRIGYDHAEMGFDGNDCGVITSIGKQSPDIAQGVDGHNALGAGDQGQMFGYACQDTDSLMPAPIAFAHQLMHKQSKLRRSGRLPWLRPDAKAQIGLVYEHAKPTAIDHVIISAQHAPDVEQATLEEALMEELIKPSLPTQWINTNTRILINPTGRFVIGGPRGDCGLTGRKIIVDSYGGMARQGGGCFSGKDPSKVDRSAAYMARYIAKNIVAAGLAERCELQLSYAIGVSEPTSVFVNCFGTCSLSGGEAELERRICNHFDLTPTGIITHLDLLKPIYSKTACFGHFGREEADFTWERLDAIDRLS